MRRLELASRSVCSICEVSGVAAGPPDGEFGVIWISAAGGGLGNRGEVGASDMVKRGASVMVCDCDGDVVEAGRLAIQGDGVGLAGVDFRQELGKCIIPL